MAEGCLWIVDFPLCLRGVNLKKIMKLCLLGIIVLSMVSCSFEKREINTDPAYVFETDSQRGFYTANAYIVAESKDSYYYVAKNDYLHVIDKETMEDSILCNKPNCLHDKRTVTTLEEELECSAYIIGLGMYNNIFYYADALYVPGHQYMVSGSAGEINPVLMRISLDGSSRKNIWDMDFKTDTKVTPPILHVMHRGVFYFIAQPETKGDPYYLFGYDVHTKKCNLLYQDTKGIDELKVVGNSLYFRRATGSPQGDHMKYDISSGEMTQYVGGADALAYEDAVLFYSFLINKEQVTHQFEMFQHDGTNKQLIDIDLEVQGGYKYLQTDGTYLFVTEMMGLGNYTVEVYDIATRDKVAGIPVPEDMRTPRYGYRLMCTNDGKLILFDESQEDGYRFFYGNIADIATNNFQWHEVQRIN